MKQQKLSVVITGASSGIGRATALEFARRGHNLALTARRREALEDVARDCQRFGAKVFTLPMDISNEDEVYEFARQVSETIGGPDVWVNNAAVAMMGPFEETPMKNIRRLIDVNLMGYLYGARAALRYFRKQGYGTLINVASQVGIAGQPYSIAYTTSKSAIRGMSLCLQQEFAFEKNIHVCTVLPATIDTPLFQNAANFMGREIRAMDPVIDAQSVAHEIIELTKCPKSEVLIGGMAVQGMLMKFFAPRLFAKLYNKQVKSKHFTSATTGPAEGNLFEPGVLASISGGWTDSDESKGMTMQVKNAFWLSVLAGGILAAAAVIIKNRT